MNLGQNQKGQNSCDIISQIVIELRLEFVKFLKFLLFIKGIKDERYGVGIIPDRIDE